MEESLGNLVRVIVWCAGQRRLATDGPSVHHMTYLYLTSHRPQLAISFKLGSDGPYSPELQEELDELVLLGHLRASDSEASQMGDLIYTANGKQDCGCFDVSAFLDWMERGSRKDLHSLSFMRFVAGLSGRTDHESWLLASRLSPMVKAADEVETLRWFSAKPV